MQADSGYAGDFIAGSGGGVCLVSDSFGTIDCVRVGYSDSPGGGTLRARDPRRLVHRAIDPCGVQHAARPE